GRNTFFLDAYAHCCNGRSSRQGLIELLQSTDRSSVGTPPGKTLAESSCGTARRCRSSAGGSPSFCCAQCRLAPDTTDNHGSRACRSTQCHDQSECAVRPCLALQRTAAHDH